MRKRLSLYQENISAAEEIWGKPSRNELLTLEQLTLRFSLSIRLGDLICLEGKWYPTHSGLLQIARRHRCVGISVVPITAFCDPELSRWAFKATVYKTAFCRGFVGFGDADPSNVSSLVRGAEMRVAETRAVNRALRKAYGIGLCSVEELGTGAPRVSAAGAMDNNHGKSQPLLRDRLLLLIRQYRLDAEQVKRYAVRFCGTNSLREATREQVQTFINHLESRAAADRDKLVAEMNATSENSAAANGKREEINARKEEKEVA